MFEYLNRSNGVVLGNQESEVIAIQTKTKMIYIHSVRSTPILDLLEISIYVLLKLASVFAGNVKSCIVCIGMDRAGEWKAQEVINKNLKECRC